MKYIIIILSITMFFACGPSEKTSSKDAQEISTSTKKDSKQANDKSSKKIKKKGRKASSKLGKKYKDIVAQNILSEDQAQRLQSINREFSDKKSELVKKDQWKGKENVKNRRKHNIDKNNSIKSAFGEDIFKKLSAYYETKLNEKS